jgi:hypothetical protein
MASFFIKPLVIFMALALLVAFLASISGCKVNGKKFMFGTILGMGAGLGLAVYAIFQVFSGAGGFVWAFGYLAGMVLMVLSPLVSAINAVEATKPTRKSRRKPSSKDSGDGGSEACPSSGESRAEAKATPGHGSNFWADAEEFWESLSEEERADVKRKARDAGKQFSWFAERSARAEGEPGIARVFRVLRRACS